VQRQVRHRCVREVVSEEVKDVPGVVCPVVWLWRSVSTSPGGAGGRTDTAEVGCVKECRVAVVDGLPCPDLLNEDGALLLETLDEG
jgi:hypothetical protein